MISDTAVHGIAHICTMNSYVRGRSPTCISPSCILPSKTSFMVVCTARGNASQFLQGDLGSHVSTLCPRTSVRSQGTRYAQPELLSTSSPVLVSPSVFLQCHHMMKRHISISTITPFILAAVAYACNGMFLASYVDLLFCCVSAMTGTGLATLDLSSLTAWQQAVLVILEIIGSPVCSNILSHLKNKIFT